MSAVEPSDDARVALYDPGFGRGWLWLGVFLVLGGFLAPFVHVTSTGRGVSGYLLATRIAPNLWIVPCIAAAFVSILGRRRTPARMRSARVAMPCLSALAAVSLVYTLARIRHSALVVAARTFSESNVMLAWGAYVVAAGILVTVIGGVRFGVPSRRRRGVMLEEELDLDA